MGTCVARGDDVVSLDSRNVAERVKEATDAGAIRLTLAMP